MKALLSAVLVPELGQVILQPGKQLLPQFGGRLLVTRPPKELRSLPDGILPNQEQQLINDHRWHSFLTHERVIKAAGGISSLVYWLRQSLGCQWNSEYHSPQEVILKYAQSAIRLCWHCDNKLCGQVTPPLEKVANRNAAEWVLIEVRQWLALPDGHQVTAHELSWWAVIKGVSDLLPEHSIRNSLRIPAKKVKPDPQRECDIEWTRPITEIMDERIEKVKPVIKLIADEEPPAGFMLRPKLRRWECEKYTRWVKSQQCACCESPADDPHHIVGYSLSGMGTKTHDLFVIPLCRQHHDELHRDVMLGKKNMVVSCCC